MSCFMYFEGYGHRYWDHNISILAGKGKALILLANILSVAACV